MAKPAGNSPTLVSHGNAATPMIGSMPMIDSRVGLGGQTLSAPGFSIPKMPTIERITPRTVNATRGLDRAQSRVTVFASRAVKNVGNAAAGFARAVSMRQRRLPRFNPGISTAYRVK